MLRNKILLCLINPRASLMKICPQTKRRGIKIIIEFLIIHIFIYNPRPILSSWPHARQKVNKCRRNNKRDSVWLQGAFLHCLKHVDVRFRRLYLWSYAKQWLLCLGSQLLDVENSDKLLLRAIIVSPTYGLHQPIHLHAPPRIYPFI